MPPAGMELRKLAAAVSSVCRRWAEDGDHTDVLEVFRTVGVEPRTITTRDRVEHTKKSAGEGGYVLGVLPSEREYARILA